MFYPFAPKLKPKTDKSLNERNNDFIKMIKETLKDESNDNCVECGANNPQYISINNSIFLCKDCILNHLQLPQEASTIIKNDLKILNFEEIQYIYNGGNRKLLDFINNEFPKLKEFPPQQLYITKAMDYYRKNLKYLTEGGTKPIKPGIKEAYELNLKKEQNDISDMYMDNEDPENNLEDPIIDNINIDELNDDKNKDFENEKEKKKYYYSTCRRDKKIINDQKDLKFNINNDNIKTERRTLPIKIKQYSCRNFNPMQSPRDTQYTHSQKEILSSSRRNEKENYKYDNIKGKQNINRVNIQNCQSTKNIKFIQNYTNFDNEKNYNNTTKGTDRVELYFNNNSNTKRNDIKDNIYLNMGLLSPQFLSSNAKSPGCESKKKNNNVYYKPKAIPFFTNYRTKTDFFKSEKKNKEFNITEFNLDDKKNNLKGSLKNIDIKDNNNEHNFAEKIKSIKKNNLLRAHKIKSKEEFEKNNKTYINTLNGKLNTRLPKMESFKILNSNRNNRHNMNINKKEEEEKSKEKDKEKRKNNHTHISVNISHFKIISNINNYNININNLKNDKDSKDLNKNIVGKTQFNFYKKRDNKNNNSTSVYFSNKYLSNTANNSKRNLRIKNEDFKAGTTSENQDKKKINKKLIDYKKNTDDENDSKTSNRNSIRSYQTFISNKPGNKELNIFKYNSRLTKKSRESSEEKKHSFYNFRERYKIKNNNNDKKEYTIEIKKLDYKTNNSNKKTKDEKLETMSINESIRNKYKKKKLKNII